MSSSICAFCKHENPARAKYCNECASPLAMGPCRACDAVNAKDAATCHRCRTPFPVLPAADVSTEMLVARADETLEALRRELAQATARTDSVPAEGDAPVSSRPPGPMASEVPQERADAPALVVNEAAEASLPRGEHFIKLNAGAASLPPDPVRPPDAPDVVVLRARRSSSAVAVAAIVAALLALPLGIYAFRNPAQLQTWYAQVKAMVQRAAPETAAPAPVPPPVAAPAIPSPPDAATAAPGATVESAPASATDAPSPVESPPSDADATAPASTSPTVSAPATEVPVEAAAAAGAAATGAAAAAAPVAKSASKPRPRASSSQQRSRERANRPRPSP